MRKAFLLILFFSALLTLWAADESPSTEVMAGAPAVPSSECLDSTLGSSPFAPIPERKAFLKHIRDSIDALPFDTTRTNDYWCRSIMNGKWGFFTDKTVRLPFPFNFARRCYNFYSKAFNNYDTTYVVGIDKDFKLMLINNNWLDSYGGTIGNNNMKVFMHSDINSSVGLHFSYMGIGYTYMFDLDNVFGGDPTRHFKWTLSFATSRFSFEGYKSRNSGRVTIERFGDYNNKKPAKFKFFGLEQNTWGFDMYYFFNHRKYSQSAAYSFSKIQKRSAGSFIAGLLVSTQNIDIDFSSLPPEMKSYLPNHGNPLIYKYHHRSYCFLVGYAYNWVFHKNWLFNITAAPSFGWNRSFDDSLEGSRNMPAIDLRGRLSLVHNAKHFFYGMQFVVDAHLYHSRSHDFINSQEDLTFIAGFRF